ncbi:unnamed protein product [Caenorhabditis angaria]|uniref:CCHC-type domain-containing protein n=1 Tax=Caenorhabditis angaria TaxID=860376 RepID=A0A9P1I3Z1_9PELO|nr:unnamed protein product [Caenorhabditis angaria]
MGIAFSSSTTINNMFDGVPRGQDDSIFDVLEAYKKDPRPDKINLSVGAYRDDDLLIGVIGGGTSTESGLATSECNQTMTSNMGTNWANETEKSTKDEKVETGAVESTIFEWVEENSEEYVKKAVATAKEDILRVAKVTKRQADVIMEPLARSFDKFVAGLCEELRESPNLVNNEEARCIRYLRKVEFADVDIVHRYMSAGAEVLRFERETGYDADGYKAQVDKEIDKCNFQVEKLHGEAEKWKNEAEMLRKKVEDSEDAYGELLEKYTKMEKEVQLLKNRKGEKTIREASPTPSFQMFSDLKNAKSKFATPNRGATVETMAGRVLEDGESTSGLSKLETDKRSENSTEKRTKDWVIHGKSKIVSDGGSENVDGHGGGKSEKSPTKTRSSIESVKDGLVAMMGFMKLNSFPDPEPFSGYASENLDEFLELFELKYGSLTGNGKEMGAILTGKFLKGHAKKLFDSIDVGKDWKWKEVKEKFEEVMNASRTSKRGRAIEKWQDMRIGKNQSLQMYCIEIEKLARDAFDASPREIDIYKTAKLLQATRRNSALAGLLAVKKNDKKDGNQYEALKSAALQFEYDLEREKYREDRKKFEKKGGSDPGESSKAKNEKSENADKDETSRTTNEKSNQGESSRRDAGRCFSCGKDGHFIANCPNRAEVNCVKTEGLCKMRPVEKATILGQQVEILIDSGSEVSLMSSKIFDKLMDGARNLEKSKWKVELPGDWSLKSCGGTNMKIIKQFEVETKIRDREEKVKFQIIEESVNMLILGLDSFKNFGIFVGWKSESNMEDSNVESGNPGVGKKRQRKRAARKIREKGTDLVQKIYSLKISDSEDESRDVSTGPEADKSEVIGKEVAEIVDQEKMLEDMDLWRNPYNIGKKSLVMMNGKFSAVDRDTLDRRIAVADGVWRKLMSKDSGCCGSESM